MFLFDEPLSNLDAALRVRMRYEFAKLHEDLKTTMIYVTHDQVEAMTLADRIVVLAAGRIEQVGSPLELYEHPDNLFVAGFIGSPKMNFLDATDRVRQRRRRRRATGDRRRRSAARWTASRAKRRRQGHLSACAPNTSRPRPPASTGNVIATSVTFVESLGSDDACVLRLPGRRRDAGLRARTAPRD